MLAGTPEVLHGSLRKVLAYAFCAGAAAFVFGLSCGHLIIRHHRWYVTASGVLGGALLAFVLLWIRHAVWRLASSETAQNSARQFLWSCIFFSMISSPFGAFVSGLIWYSHDIIRIAGAVWFGLLTCIAIYPVRRDAKRLVSALV